MQRVSDGLLLLNLAFLAFLCGGLFFQRLNADEKALEAARSAQAHQQKQIDDTELILFGRIK